ncbi:interleukin-2 receptor subunit beta isoform X2 [Xyrauchen texanus]|uniref:interleukin-2 receptor subunit beta isoform X2 n=1 Tax=Xyrauchen texanus TaxID=154827 RepID=UPI00224276D3|nr:interleukin-2 receptor subunit beta isoform X2 [Xyrauchen texanus]
MMQILSMNSLKMTVVMMSLFYSVLSDQSLECYNDYYSTFTCVWNTSKLTTSPPIRPDSNCSLNIVVNSTKPSVDKTAKLSPDSAEPNIRRATIQFQHKTIYSILWIYQNVTCDNFVNPVAVIPKHQASKSVKVSPPQNVQVDRLNVSWSFGSSNTKSNTYTFELQVKSAAQNWMDKDITAEMKDTHLELPEERLTFHEQYVVRVRVKLLLTNAIWSEWSREYSWTSEVGKRRTTHGPGLELLDWSSFVIGITLTGITLAIISIFAIRFKCNKIIWFEKIQTAYIPDPSKYFDDLNSHHKGNLKSWLGSVFTLEVDSECVSPVEVIKPQDCNDSRHTKRIVSGLQDKWESSAKSSDFSNSTYFLSQSSSGPQDTLEPCPAHCSYGPVTGVQHSTVASAEEKDGGIEMESALKRLEQLRHDTQSPDSGFAAGAEDSLEETDLPSPLSLNPLRHLPLDLPAPHPNRLLLSGWERTPLMLGSNCLIPAIELDLDLHSSCGLIEPCSGDYMPVKIVQN